jgi:hypothetical protein
LPTGIVRTYTGDNWLRITLNRPSLATILWDGTSPPSWLNSWRSLGNNRYQRLLPAGRNILGAIGGTANRPYTLHLAEADGSAPRAPAVPAGLATPQPNQACPDWVHNRHVAIGPDGREYLTWHPAIDPVYWCYFGHEHGADAASFMPSGYKPPFHYTAYYNNRQNESNQGFKGFTFLDRQNNHWYVMAHMGTETIARFTARFHTVSIRVESPTGELLADLQYKADFGATISNRRINGGEATTTLPNMEAIRQATQGRIRARIVEPDGSFFTGYETWTMAVNAASGAGLGLVGQQFIFDNLNPMTGCNGLACTTAFRPADLTNNKGDRRGLRVRGDFIIRADRAVGTGVFYTDQYGLRRMDGPADNIAVRQYIRPGLVLAPFPSGGDTTMITQNAWGGISTPNVGPTAEHDPATHTDLEGSLNFN